MPPLLLVGLGNPGPEYAGTRHNIGFEILDSIAARYGFSAPREKFSGQFVEGAIGGVKMYALKPMTYMNRSGEPVRKAAQFYKIPLENIIVIHDDLDLAPGRVRVKTGGGDGGHNGLKSLDEYLGKEYRRIRTGIGHPGHKDMVSGYVLSRPSKDERDAITAAENSIGEAFPLLLEEGGAAKFTTKLALLMRNVKPEE